MNVLQERYQFYHRKQKYHESFEDFAAEIRRLASACRFDSQEESLIRDHFLFGLKNKKISDQIMQNGGDPSVTDILELCIEQKRPRGPGRRSNGKENIVVKNEASAVFQQELSECIGINISKRIKQH